MNGASQAVPGGDTEAIFLQEGSEHVRYAAVLPRAETALLFGFRMECKSLSPAHKLPQNLAPLPSVPLAHTPHTLPLGPLSTPSLHHSAHSTRCICSSHCGPFSLPVSELLLPRSVLSSPESLSSGLGTHCPLLLSTACFLATAGSAPLKAVPEEDSVSQASISTPTPHAEYPQIGRGSLGPPTQTLDPVALPSQLQLPREESPDSQEHLHSAHKRGARGHACSASYRNAFRGFPSPLSPPPLRAASGAAVKPTVGAAGPEHQESWSGRGPWQPLPDGSLSAGTATSGQT
ncbi:unnamed protein product [Rangifer tarandus platyrhynchus]|uniref:Uncharacterized protein n=1 Tax=Rangifer tarandus platyrhynchus TaxID=3082113 RepID=A0AC59YWZ1_RANTA